MDSTEAQKEFYSQVFTWVKLQMELLAARPYFVGVSAPQGGGKTTLTAALCDLAKQDQLHAVAVSVDDFYLTRTEQLELSRQHPDNPYWQQRGYPGTHDTTLGTQTLSALKHLSATSHVSIPSYDKSAHKGQGDRKPRDQWAQVQAPIDLVFLEGWMLGFKAIGNLQDPALRDIDKGLTDYEPWLAALNAFVWLEPADKNFVLDWRVEAEQRMRAAGKPGMSDVEIKAYIAKFLPAYEIYLPGLKKAAPISGPSLHYVLQRSRLPRL